MFTIETTSYGIKVRREGFPADEESRELLTQYLKALENAKRSMKAFGHMFDLRGFKPGGPETQEIIKTIMQKFKEAGGVRSGVILDSPIAVMQIRRLARESGIYAWERYVDPETHPDFEQKAIAWIEYGEDPDTRMAG